MMATSMKNRFGLLAAVALMAAVGMEQAQAAPGWIEGIDAGVARAKVSGKPLFVVFRCVR